MEYSLQQNVPRPAAARQSIAVFVVAYNASETITQVLNRIPEASWSKIDEVFIFDDFSTDDTTKKALDYSGPGANKIKVFRNQVNLGYGGNQKRGYLYAINSGFDIVVLLHGDGQYAPEYLEKLVAPIANGQADAVFGSRMLEKGAARKGGMPLYKYVGNRILSSFQNFMLGQDLSEYHSGYRAYSVHALRKVPFTRNSNDFHFDTEIIIQFLEAGLTIKEIPIPTYYGDEICYVNGLAYAWNVVKSTVGYKLHKKGMLYKTQFYIEARDRYTFKKNKYSSHNRIIQLIEQGNRGLAGKRILDIGCGSGELAARLSELGCEVVGVDSVFNEHAESVCKAFHVLDIERHLDIPHDKFDVVIFADVLEHVREPESLLLKARTYLKEDGHIVASTGNVANIVIRLMLLLGSFNYTEKGILDRTHVRLFTRRTFRKLFRDCSLRIEEEDYCPIPFENIFPYWTRTSDALAWMYMSMVKLRPPLFAYQFVLDSVVDRNAPNEILRQQEILRPVNSLAALSTHV